MIAQLIRATLFAILGVVFLTLLLAVPLGIAFRDVTTTKPSAPYQVPYCQPKGGGAFGPCDQSKVIVS